MQKNCTTNSNPSTRAQILPQSDRSKKSMAYEAPFCIVCGKDLVHKPTGRPRRFCSARCKQKDYREIRRWASAAVDAIRCGMPEPPLSWRHTPRPDQFSNARGANSAGRAINPPTNKRS